MLSVFWVKQVKILVMENYEDKSIPHEYGNIENIEEEYVRVGTTLFRILNQPMMNGSFRKMRVEWKNERVPTRTTARTR